MSLERTGPTRVVQSSEHLDLSLNWSAKFKEVDYYVFKEVDYYVFKNTETKR